MNSEKPSFNYQNFDLLIEPAGKAYVARVTNSPAGEAATPFNLPFSALELENFLLKIGRPRRGVRRLNSPEMEAAKVFGKRLFDSVFGSEVFGCLRSSLDQTEAKGSAGLRLRLRLNAPELADLPWEYLYNSALNRFLVLAVETPLVRYIELPERIRPLAVQPPLKILVMLSSPTDYPQLDVEEEWTKLQNALGDLQKRKLVTLERLDEATLPGLQRRLRQSPYHIFHFIGHGGYDDSARDGVLLLEDETRHSRKVSGQFLGTILHNHRPLRLAVLNACEGARASRTDPFTGTAQSLVQQGLPAVIAMQFEITDAAAITLSHEFYAALADGYPVDAALVEARTAIFASGNDVEWGTPVLYMRAPDGKIFDLERVQPPPISETPKPKAPPSQPVAEKKKPIEPLPIPETPKPKESPVSPPPRKPVAEKPKPVAPPLPKPAGASKRPLLLAGLVLTLAVMVWLIYKNVDWGQSPEKQKPAEKTRLSTADSLYFKHKSDGDAFFNQGDFAKAKQKYQQALAQRRGDQYATDKISACDRMMTAQQDQAERDRLYTQYRNEGNALYQQKKYTAAHDKFDAALQQKPNDGYATARKQACEERMAEQQKSYETYKTAGDKLFKQAEYARAKDQYELALSYRDNDSYLGSQIKECDRLLLAAKRTPPEAPVETKPATKYSLRRVSRDNLSAEAVKNMLKQRDFYCGEYSWSKEWSNPQGRGLDNDFVLQSDDKVVLDRATGLMWQHGGSSESMTFANAEKYILDLNNGTVSGGAGFRDWRLPTLEEAMSLMEPTKLDGDLYIDPKFDKTQRWIWTADKESAGVAWVANFFYGGCNVNVVAYYLHNFVRAVRVAVGQ